MGQVIPQQRLVHTTAPGVPADDRTRLDLVVYGATPRGGALCCDAILVSPFARTGHPQPGAADTDGAVLRVAERRKRSTYMRKMSAMFVWVYPAFDVHHAIAAETSHHGKYMFA